MGGTLLVWKAPRVADENEASRLLGDYYTTANEAAFEPSEDVARFYDELIALYPPLEEIGTGAASSWAATPTRSDRIVSMDYVWSASGEFLDDIERLARAHGLVLYDPQGPVVIDPEAPETEFVADTREVLRVALLCAGALLVGYGAWYVSITVVSWIVMVIAGFLAAMAAYTLVVYALQARRRRRA